MSKRADPDDPINKIMTVTKPDVAKSQLETALTLWFNDADPVSIHTLAVAAHDCLGAIAKSAGKPFRWQELMTSYSQAIQDSLRYPQNFFKHGLKDLKGKARFQPFDAEIRLYDSALLYESTLGNLTPLMKAFLLRFAFRFPDYLTLDIKDLIMHETGLLAADLESLSRSDFLKKVLPPLQDASRSPSCS